MRALPDGDRQDRARHRGRLQPPRARRGQRRRLRHDRRGGLARDDPALDAERRRGPRRRPPPARRRRRGARPLHRRRHADHAGLGHVQRAPARDLRARARGPAGRHRRGATRRRVPRPEHGGDEGPRPGPLRPRHPHGRPRGGAAHRAAAARALHAARRLAHARHRRARLRAREARPSTSRGVLEVGYVLTVEPGLYFQPDDLTVPEQYRGIGVRIEDDVLVTDDGCRVLSGSRCRGTPTRSRRGWPSCSRAPHRSSGSKDRSQRDRLARRSDAGAAPARRRRSALRVGRRRGAGAARPRRRTRRPHRCAPGARAARPALGDVPGHDEVGAHEPAPGGGEPPQQRGGRGERRVRDDPERSARQPKVAGVGDDHRDLTGAERARAARAPDPGAAPRPPRARRTRAADRSARLHRRRRRARGRRGGPGRRRRAAPPTAYRAGGTPTSAGRPRRTAMYMITAAS